MEGTDNIKVDSLNMAKKMLVDAFEGLTLLTMVYRMTPCEADKFIKDIAFQAMDDGLFAAMEKFGMKKHKE